MNVPVDWTNCTGRIDELREKLESGDRKWKECVPKIEAIIVILKEYLAQLIPYAANQIMLTLVMLSK